MKIVLGAMMASLLLSTTAMAQTYNERTIKFAATGASGTPPVLGMEIFTEKLAEQSQGQMKTKVFANGILGGDVQVLSSLQGGVVEMMVWNAGNMITQSKDFGILDLPFIFADAAAMDGLLDGELGDSLIAQLPEHGVIGLAFWEQGFRHLTNNTREVATLEDIKGLKIRVQQNQLLVDMWQALGASPTPMAITELYTALETGAVDGQEAAAPFIVGANYHEVQKFISLTAHNYNPQIVLIGKPFWDKLNDDEKQLITKVARETALEQRKISRDAAAEAVETIKANGNVVTTIAPEELAKMRAATHAVVVKYAKEFTPALTELVFKTMNVVVD